MPGRQGSIRLFSYSGIDVFLHWSWFLLAMYEIRGGLGTYSSIGWNIAEYLSLFLIVTIHEFGHALACRQVGGFANRIVLWPMGGVAYVDPPPRPGATLWSIAAGPLVNVVLLPVFYVLASLSPATLTSAFGDAATNVHALLHALLFMDAALLIFNMLPIYPLDGGQILRSLLWFVLGRGRSLMVATLLGLVGVVGFIGLALWMGSIWYGALAVFMLMNCWNGLKQARVLLRLAKLPRRAGFACPRCQSAPPVGEMWKCGRCGQPFDTFQTGATCPSCGAQFGVTSCMDCGGVNPINRWATPA